MKTEYDFSKAARDQFYYPNDVFIMPHSVYRVESFKIVDPYTLRVSFDAGRVKMMTRGSAK
jgi:hypothetical protein